MFLAEARGWEVAGTGGAYRAAASGPQRRDLARDIGSRRWWGDAATLAALLAATWCLAPPLRPLAGAIPPPLAGAELDEARAQGIAPLAFGATTGRRVAAGSLVRPLAAAPERPSIELVATVGERDTLAAALGRAGVARAEAAAAQRLSDEASGSRAPAAGTPLAVTLGRRPARTAPRPLERLAFRAAIDLRLTLLRGRDGLRVERRTVMVDRTPLRLRGTIGLDLLASLRAAGAPARLAADYAAALRAHLAAGDVRAGDRFTLVADSARTASGEAETGALQYAGLDRGGLPLAALVRWDAGDGEGGGAFVDATGRAEGGRGRLALPVAGRITSSFGYRVHPLLGYLRLHKGIDLAAPTGTPVVAALDGIVASAGWNGGYGRFVRLEHAGGYASGYGHLSAIAAVPGTRVRRGDLLGFVGTSGLSTGPHLHWEVWRGGVALDPQHLSAATAAAPPAETLAAVRDRARQLLGAR